MYAAVCVCRNGDGWRERESERARERERCMCVCVCMCSTVPLFVSLVSSYLIQSNPILSNLIKSNLSNPIYSSISLSIDRVDQSIDWSWSIDRSILLILLLLLIQSILPALFVVSISLSIAYVILKYINIQYIWSLSYRSYTIFIYRHAFLQERWLCCWPGLAATDMVATDIVATDMVVTSWQQNDTGFIWFLFSFDPIILTWISRMFWTRTSWAHMKRYCNRSNMVQLWYDPIPCGEHVMQHEQAFSVSKIDDLKDGNISSSSPSQSSLIITIIFFSSLQISEPLTHWLVRTSSS